MVTISKSLSSSHTTPNELLKSVPFTPDDELPQTAQALTGDYDSSKPVCPFLNNVTHKTTQLNKIPVRITTRTRQHSHIKSPRHRSTLRPIQVNKTAPSQPRLIPCCLVLNARSIAKPDAFSALCADIKCNNIDVCCITETWLKPTIPTILDKNVVTPRPPQINVELRFHVATLNSGEGVGVTTTFVQDCLTFVFLKIID